MAKHNVEESIINVVCSCTTDWLDTRSVDPRKYNYRYNQAILTQNLIGWCRHHVFMGKLSQEWLHLQPYTTDNNGNNRSYYIWEASLVEASIKSHMGLWGQQNKDAHSPEAHIHLAEERAAEATGKLYEPRHQARFKDSALFPDDVETFIEESTTKKLQRYILMNSKAI